MPAGRAMVSVNDKSRAFAPLRVAKVVQLDKTKLSNLLNASKKRLSESLENSPVNVKA